MKPTRQFLPLRQAVIYAFTRRILNETDDVIAAVLGIRRVFQQLLPKPAGS